MSQQHQFVLGIDGGGTHTRAALMDSTGEVIGIGNAGPSNYQNVGVEDTRNSIRAAVVMAYQTAGLEVQPAAAAFLGMAGLASGADRATIESIARQLGLARLIDADHDIRTALAGGLAGDEGIALIAGTGSSCYGRTADGRSWRSGGWGGLLDDRGAGYWLGLQGLVAVTRAADGRAEPTALAELLMPPLGLNDINDIIRALEYEHRSRTDIAALAHLVLQAWKQGDAAATAIVAQGTDELALMARAVALQLGWRTQRIAIATIGGLFADSSYQAAVASAITRHLPHASVMAPMLPPSIGAAILALKRAGTIVDGTVIEQMRTSLQQRSQHCGAGEASSSHTSAEIT